jgi:acyl-CoA synthetase (AMP-forming)/AMP-acid ligase II
MPSHAPDSRLLHELLERSASGDPGATALTLGAGTRTYGQLQDDVAALSGALAGLGMKRHDRIAIWLEKRFETVVASFGATAAGCVFVPMNPLLKPEQVLYIARDCNVRLLVTTPERLALLEPLLAQAPDLRHVVLTESAAQRPAPAPGLALHG